MNCRGWNPRIALQVEGDLEPESARQLEKHLEGCDECRRFASALQDRQIEIRQLRSDLLPAASLDRVRANVLQQVRMIEARRTWLDRLGIWFWGGFRWRYAVLSSVALILISAIAWRMSLKQFGLASPVLQVAATVQASQPTALALSGRNPMAAKRSVKRPAVVDERGHLPVLPAIPETIATETAVEEEAVKPPETLVQIQTDDPNVVIYWLIDQPGGF